MSWLRLFLLPFSILYGIGVWVRNLLFDHGILPSESFPLPIISVGNLSSGGTGKTPQVEYLVRLLKNDYRIAVISRGYKRKTSGYLLAKKGISAGEIGDEPLQVFNKFPEILVAVHENRRKGIRRIIKDHPETNLIILDDAFQHRYVKPGLNLLLTGYYHPFFRNYLLPVGNLREARHRAKRADALIVTKTPKVFSPIDRRYFLDKLKKHAPGQIFFSTLHYQPMQPVTQAAPPCPPADIKTIFLLTGIANPEALLEHLKPNCKELFHHKYPDHHQFTERELKKLKKEYEEAISYCKVVVTTEKDAMRLLENQLLDILANIPVYYLPVEVAFQMKDKSAFDRMVHDFLAGYPPKT